MLGLAGMLVWASCASSAWYFRPAVGGSTVVASAGPQSDVGAARGQAQGTTVHLDFTGGHRWPWLQLGLAIRTHIGVDYRGRCRPTPDPNCVGEPFTRDLFSIYDFDFLALRVRLWPWSKEHIDTGRLGVMFTFNVGRAFLSQAVPYNRVVGIVPLEEGLSRWGWSVSPGAAANYRITSWLAIEAAIDFAWMSFSWPFEHLGFVTFKAGPLLLW